LVVGFVVGFWQRLLNTHLSFAGFAKIELLINSNEQRLIP
jgi:hypothetical protein